MYCIYTTSSNKFDDCKRFNRLDRIQCSLMKDGGTGLTWRFLKLDSFPSSERASHLKTLVPAIRHEQSSVITELTQARLVKLAQISMFEAFRELLDEVSEQIKEIETAVVERTDDNVSFGNLQTHCITSTIMVVET